MSSNRDFNILPIKNNMRYTDRFLQDGRKNKDSNVLPVQNEYLQKYQLTDLQSMYFNYNEIEKMSVDRIMEKKIPSDANLIDRNRDISMLYGQNNPLIKPSQFMFNPVDTRREKYELIVDREPTAKVLGGPRNFYEKND